MAAVDHLDLVVSSLPRSLGFYSELLKPLGWRWVSRVEGERGETIHYLFAANGRASIGLREAPDGQDQPDRYRIGLHHVAFRARSRRQVDERASWLVKNDIQLESEPQHYGYSPGYYAVFFYDPDGLKLEIVFRPALRSLLWSLNPRTSP